MVAGLHLRHVARRLTHEVLDRAGVHEPRQPGGVTRQTLGSRFALQATQRSDLRGEQDGALLQPGGRGARVEGLLRLHVDHADHILAQADRDADLRAHGGDGLEVVLGRGGVGDHDRPA